MKVRIRDLVWTRYYKEVYGQKVPKWKVEKVDENKEKEKEND